MIRAAKRWMGKRSDDFRNVRNLLAPDLARAFTRYKGSISRRIKLASGRHEIRKTGFWFVDIPRTSSSSIRAQLGHRFGIGHGKLNIPEKDRATEQIFDDHLCATEMREILGSRLWSEIFTFTVVRNPWERMFSLYMYLQKNTSGVDGRSFDEFVKLIHQERNSPGSTIFTYRPLSLSNLDFITDENGEIIVDKIVRFEDREKDLAEIGERIGCPELGTLKINSARPQKSNFQDFYSKETRDLVSEMFADDIEYFGYTFEDICEQ